MAVQAILDSAITFCEESMAIREALDMIYTIGGVDYYELDAPSQDNQISRILSVRVDGVNLQAIPEDNAHLLRDRDGTPTMFSTRRTGSVLEMQLYPRPIAVSAVIVEAALQPTRVATTLDNDLFNVWPDPIIEGALGRLLRIPHQPFTDGAYSMSMMASASRKTAKARTESQKGRTRGAQIVRMRPLA